VQGNVHRVAPNVSKKTEKANMPRSGQVKISNAPSSVIRFQSSGWQGTFVLMYSP
jgi:hypothetical protein